MAKKRPNRQPEIPDSFEDCLALIRKREDQSTQEAGYHALWHRADQFVDELIAALNDPQNAEIKSWIIELLGDSRTVKGLNILKRMLLENTPMYKTWVVDGILNNFTKDQIHDVVRLLEQHEQYTTDVDPFVREMWDEFKRRGWIAVRGYA